MIAAIAGLSGAWCVFMSLFAVAMARPLQRSNRAASGRAGRH
jgi:hypothetical protein